MCLAVPIWGCSLKKMLTRTRILQFLRAENGTSTVEFVIWLPMLLIVVAFAADTAIIFTTKSEILQIIQDANRAAAVGRLSTAAATQAFVEDRLGALEDVSTVTSTFANGLVSTTVSVPTSEMTATGILGMVSNLTMSINAQHLLEL